MRLFAEQRVQGRQHAGRAESALKRMMLLEGCLQRSEPLLHRKAFDGGDLRALRLYGEHQAGARAAPVEQNRAGPADAVLAADMRTRELQFVTQEIGKHHAHRHGPRISLAIDLEVDRAGFGHALHLVS